MAFLPPVGVSNFLKLRKAGSAYVHKTAALVHTLEQHSEVILFTRPRRFGKTLLLSTFEAFLQRREVIGEDTTPLFQDLAVWRSPEARAHRQRHAVVSANFKDVRDVDRPSTWVALRLVLAAMVRRVDPLLAHPAVPEERRRWLNSLAAMEPSEAHRVFVELSEALYLATGESVVILDLSPASSRRWAGGAAGHDLRRRPHQLRDQLGRRVCVRLGGAGGGQGEGYIGAAMAGRGSGDVLANAVHPALARRDGGAPAQGRDSKAVGSASVIRASALGRLSGEHVRPTGSTPPARLLSSGGGLSPEDPLPPNPTIPEPPMPTLRPIHPHDDLLPLDLAAREREVAALPPDFVPTFVRLQAEAQRQGYLATWPELRDLLVELDGQVAGRVVLHRDASRVLVIDMVILPAFRRRGLSRQILDLARSEAREHGVPVEFSTLMGNPHLQTFLHQGFRVVGERPPHLLLRWDPDEPDETYAP